MLLKGPKLRKWLSLGALTLTLTSCGGGGGPESSSFKESGKREWLVLVYMAADNNLNDFAYQDLKEIEQVKFPPQVKLVVMADFLENNETLIAESSQETGKVIENWQERELDTGSESTLYSFIKEYETKYPADKVALILWDHGDGWRSYKIAAVDQSNSDMLYMYKVRDALKKLNEEGYKVDLIGFDECLMAMAEVFYDVGNYTQAVVASEALEPGDGWNYQTLFSKLIQNPSITPYQFGKLIVDSYKEAYKGQPDKTMLLLSQKEITSLTSAINALSEKLNQDTFPEFEAARENATVVDDNQDGSLFHVDLLSFTKNLPFQEAKNIESIVNGAYKYISQDLNLSGIAIYFPPTKDSDASFPCYLLEKPSSQIECFNDPNYYNPFAVNEWDDFLNYYYYLQEENGG